MISYVKGPLVAIEEDVIVVEAGHVGLAIHVLSPCFRSFREWGKR